VNGNLGVLGAKHGIGITHFWIKELLLLLNLALYDRRQTTASLVWLMWKHR